MSLVVLLILAVVWAVFLIPQVVRARAEKTPADSIGAFQAQLSVLERATPAPWAVARPGAVSSVRRAAPVRSHAQIAKRRRDVVLALVLAMTGSLLLAMLPPLRFLLAVHILCDVLFVAYLGLLARARAVSVEREMKVRYLPERPVLTAPEPALLLRHYGG